MPIMGTRTIKETFFFYLTLLICCGLLSCDQSIDNTAQREIASTEEGEDQVLNGLVMYYEMDSDTATLIDQSDNKLHATVTNSPSLVSGVYGNATSFTGTEYLAVGNDSAFELSSQISISAWVKFDDLNQTWLGIVSFAQSGGYAIWQGGAWASWQSEINFLLDNGVGYMRASFPLSDLTEGNWYYIVGTYDGAEMNIYLNGELKNQQTVSGSIDAPSAGSSLYIGAELQASNGVDKFFLGDIDQVRIYDRALTIGEIRTLYSIQR